MQCMPAPHIESRHKVWLGQHASVKGMKDDAAYRCTVDRPWLSAVPFAGLVSMLLLTATAVTAIAACQKPRCLQ